MIYMSDGEPLITTADPADNQARLELVCKTYAGRPDSAGDEARRMVEELALAACAETTTNGQTPTHDVTNATHRREWGIIRAYNWERLARFEREQAERKAQYEALRPTWIGKRVQVKGSTRTDPPEDDTQRKYHGCRGTVLDIVEDLDTSPTDQLPMIELLIRFDDGREDEFWLTGLDALP